MSFKLIVAGGRDYADYDRMAAELFTLAEGELDAEEVEIVSGAARGADALAILFAERENVVCHRFPAEWDKYGKRAGFMRNTQMGEFADGLIAFWDGESRGTAHMIQTMERLEKPYWIIYY